MRLAEKNVMRVFLNSYFLQVGSICYYLSKKKKKSLTIIDYNTKIQKEWRTEKASFKEHETQEVLQNVVTVKRLYHRIISLL